MKVFKPITVFLAATGGVMAKSAEKSGSNCWQEIGRGDYKATGHIYEDCLNALSLPDTFKGGKVAKATEFLADKVCWYSASNKAALKSLQQSPIKTIKERHTCTLKSALADLSNLLEDPNILFVNMFSKLHKGFHEERNLLRNVDKNSLGKDLNPKIQKHTGIGE